VICISVIFAGVDSAVIKLNSSFVGTKGVSQNHLLSFDNNKVLKIINWIC